MFGHMNEPFTISRDVKAIIIPAGEQLTLREGTNGFITQALGGSFTVYVEGNLFRIAGRDADAIGKEPVPPPLPNQPQESTTDDLSDIIFSRDAQVSRETPPGPSKLSGPVAVFWDFLCCFFLNVSVLRLVLWVSPRSFTEMLRFSLIPSWLIRRLNYMQRLLNHI